MSVVVVGLQHKQAPLPLLEAVAIGDADLHKVLGSLRHRRNLQETVVLSTCLRTEVYAVVDRFHDAVAEIYDVLSERSGGLEGRARGLRRRPLRRRRGLPPLRRHRRDSSRRCSGESEVVGQVRRAYEQAQEEGMSGPGPVRPLPTRAADRQACAHRDRDRPWDHLVLLRRRGRGAWRRRRRPA